MLFSFALVPLDMAFDYYKQKHGILPKYLVTCMSQLERVLGKGLMSGVPHEVELDNGVVACWHYRSEPGLIYRLGPIP